MQVRHRRHTSRVARQPSRLERGPLWFCFVQERDKNLGGNSLFRSEERIATEKRYLKRKWKAHIRIETYKSQDRVAMDAPRRQSVKL